MLPRRRSALALVATAVVGGLVATALPSARADDYTNADYAAFDVDNMTRSRQRQSYHFTTPDYWLASQRTFNTSWLEGVGRQNRDLQDLRVYAGLGQIIPGGNVGDPERFSDGKRFTVEFENREGTNLVGHVWPCAGTLACPGVVVTTGSLQATQAMYFWLARHLQTYGYTVFTYDVRGQGESETTTHPATSPFPALVNPQDEANFVNGTVDALRFFIGTAEPEWNLDPARLALVGHSLGARAVSVVQQCSNAYGPGLADLPVACDGQRWPIRAIVAYDSLSAAGVVPVVPAFSHTADGYFLNPQPTPQSPGPDERTGATSSYGRWVAAGQDACAISVRGGTHLEWSEIPYILPATRYGVPQAAYYTRAWLDRYVGVGTAASGFSALEAGPVPTPAEPPGGHLDHRASLFSGKYRSACRVADPGGGAPFAEDDLRDYAGVAAVGDWAAINAEREYGVVAPKGAL